MQMLMTRKQKTTTDANISDTTEKTKQEMTLDCLIGWCHFVYELHIGLVASQQPESFLSTCPQPPHYPSPLKTKTNKQKKIGAATFDTMQQCHPSAAGSFRTF